MGVRQDIFEEAHARAVTVGVTPVPYDCAGHPELWQVKWRDAADRKGWLVCKAMVLFRWMGLPSTAWYHDMTIASTEEKALAFKAYIEQVRGGVASIYPMAVDELLPFEPIRPKRMFSARMRKDEILENRYELVERRQFEALIRELDV